MKAGRAEFHAYTIAELLISSSIGIMIISVLVFVSLGLQKSMSATDQYVVGMNDGSRLLDYVAQDLRRAIRVSLLNGGASTPLKNDVSFGISETNTLSINIADYYQSNTPDPSPGSAFRTSRYDRVKLNLLSAFNGNGASALNGVIFYKEAITKVGNVEMVRFAPNSAGMGEIEVRYYRGPRSATDSTPCFFRGEYPVGQSSPYYRDREIAERVVSNGSTTSVVVSMPNLSTKDLNYGRTFKLTSGFTPRFRRNGAAPPSEQSITVLVRNARRD